MAYVNDTAPVFSAPGTEGEEIERYQLNDYLNEGATVLAFYPFDFSPVCVDQLCEFRDIEWLNFTDGVDILGISTDSAYCHREFINQYNLSFPLLSDSDGTITERYNVQYEEWEDHPRVAKRAILVIDSDGVVQFRWLTENALEKPSLENIQEVIESLGVELE